MSHHFHVAIRCRPSVEEKAWKVEGGSLQLVGGDSETFSFEQILKEGESHAVLYEQAVSPLVESALRGQNAFVVVYGLPRSGKTHAVFGSAGQVRAQQETRGVIVRCGQQVFDALSSEQVCRVSATFCHVFEDGRVADLLDSRRRRLEVVEERSGAFSVPGLTEHPVSSPLELVRLTEKANLMRNASGCRRQPSAAGGRPSVSPAPSQQPYKQHCSHAVFTLKVERLRGREGGKEEGEGKEEKVVTSHITVVDLAGYSIGLAQAGQLCPDSGIETLHQVIAALPSRGIVAVSSLFHQSSLTKILKPAFGGNSETLLIGTLSHSESEVESTRRCLQLLQEAAKIKSYCRPPSPSPLADTALGRTLQQIDSLRSEVCVKVGVSLPVRSWEGGAPGSRGLTINGSVYSELSASCEELAQKICKLEGQLVRAGVRSRRERPLAPELNKHTPHKAVMPAPVRDRAPVPTHIPPPKLFLTPNPYTQPEPAGGKRRKDKKENADSGSGSSLDSDSSSDSDTEQNSHSTATSSGPPPPPLRGIPHVKPDSAYIPPRKVPPTSAPARTPAARQEPWRPASHPEHSLASSSRVSSAVSSSSEAPTSPHPHMSHPTPPILPHSTSSGVGFHRQDSPANSSVTHVSPQPRPQPHPPLPPRPTSHIHRPQLHIGSANTQPFPPPVPVRLVRPVFPRPVVRPPPPLLVAQPPTGQDRPSSRGHSEVLTSTPKARRSLMPELTSHDITSTHASPASPQPALTLPDAALSPVHPATPGSLTPIAGSPASSLSSSPSPSPSPAPPPPPPDSGVHPPPTLSTLPQPNFPPSQLPSTRLPPVAVPSSNAGPLPLLLPTLQPKAPLGPILLPPTSPSSPPARDDGPLSETSSSSLTLTKSDISDEARDEFDPVMRSRLLPMYRARQYDGQMAGHQPLPLTPHTHTIPTVTNHNLPPYEQTSMESTQAVRGEEEGREEGREEGGRGGGGGNMSEYTSSEEIHVAAMEGVKSSQLKKLAIRYGVDYKDHGGRTPLMYAILGNQPRMCDILLELGAKVNIRDNTGLTPLLWATFQAKPQCMKALLRRGADVMIRDREGRSVFHWAVKSPNIQTLKTLYKQATPAIINTADNEGLTPLHWAVMCDQPAHVQVLLASTSADVSMRDAEGRTALAHAVLNSSPSCIKVILEHHEEAANHRDEKGRTALHYACAEGSTNTVRTLLTSRSCDLHCRDARGTTPLHWAAAANQPSIIQLLLRRGANRSILDNDDMTALKHAEVRGHSECVHILQSYGLRRPSSALSIASQVSVHTAPPPSLDQHGHVTLHRPQRKFSLSSQGSLHSLDRLPADGQAHTENSSGEGPTEDHTHWVESRVGGEETQQVVQSEQSGGGEWWRVLMCGVGGCTRWRRRRRNTIAPAPVT